MTPKFSKAGLGQEIAKTCPSAEVTDFPEIGLEPEISDLVRAERSQTNLR